METDTSYFVNRFRKKKSFIFEHGIWKKDPLNSLLIIKKEEKKIFLDAKCD